MILSDILILFILARWFELKSNRALLIYWCSPVCFYINYYHGQLDAVPMAIFLLSLVFLFDRRYYLAVALLACSIATKAHLAITLPFIFAYVYRQAVPVKKMFYMFLLLVSGIFVLIIPYAFSEGTIILLSRPRSRRGYLRSPFQYWAT
ncbi:MAG: hypothetical protein QMD05_10510 [Candidatus Brocadiaceae bacterium]|nr:hypothetical protein [Candidatus Brocadiaceae bacterium]